MPCTVGGDVPNYHVSLKTWQNINCIIFLKKRHIKYPSVYLKNLYPIENVKH